MEQEVSYRDTQILITTVKMYFPGPSIQD